METPSSGAPTDTEWTDELATDLAVLLAVRARAVDYDVATEWEYEAAGDNNDLVVDPGKWEFLDRAEWDRMVKVRSWWLFFRQEAGVNLADAAVEIGVDKSALSRWERGERTPNGEPRRRYQAWLQRQRDGLLRFYASETFRLAAIRDDWPYWPEGTEREAIWREFWRVGGWVDQWRRTGNLPNTNRLEHLSPLPS